MYSVIYFPASRETLLNAASVLLLFRFIWLSAVLTPEASGIFSVPLHHPPPPPNPLCLNPLRYCSRNATDTILKTQSIRSCMAFYCFYLFTSVPVADGGSLSLPVLLVDVVLGSSEKQLVMILVKKECYLFGCEGCAPTLLTFIICGCSQTLASAYSPIGSPALFTFSTSSLLFLSFPCVWK